MDVEYRRQSEAFIGLQQFYTAAIANLQKIRKYLLREHAKWKLLIKSYVKSFLLWIYCVQQSVCIREFVFNNDFAFEVLKSFVHLHFCHFFYLQRPNKEKTWVRVGIGDASKKLNWLLKLLINILVYFSMCWLLNYVCIILL